MKKSPLSVAMVLVTAIPGTASADGLPLPVDASNNGVLNPAGDVRFLTATARAHTAVFSQDPRDGSVIAVDMLDGRFTVPTVSYDGTAGGLSGDENTVVLIRPRTSFPRKRTTFAVLDSDRPRLRLRLRRLVHLRGDFSFDALSPDGNSLFLINYVSRKDPTRYRVRVFDLARGQLVPKPIVDPREEPDEMNGLPVSRVTSDDGRWAYTLYDGTEGHPFVHALDTVGRKARCIDLDDVHGDPFKLRLDAGGSGDELTVVRGRKVVAVVDTSTFAVNPPPDAPAPTAERTGGVSWPMPAGALVLLGGGLLAAALRARPR